MHDIYDMPDIASSTFYMVTHLFFIITLQSGLCY